MITGRTDDGPEGIGCDDVEEPRCPRRNLFAGGQVRYQARGEADAPSLEGGIQTGEHRDWLGALGVQEDRFQEDQS